MDYFLFLKRCSATLLTVRVSDNFKGEPKVCDYWIVWCQRGQQALTRTGKTPVVQSMAKVVLKGKVSGDIEIRQRNRVGIGN